MRGWITVSFLLPAPCRRVVPGGSRSSVGGSDERTRIDPIESSSSAPRYRLMDRGRDRHIRIESRAKSSEESSAELPEWKRFQQQFRNILTKNSSWTSNVRHREYSCTGDETLRRNAASLHHEGTRRSRPAIQGLNQARSTLFRRIEFTG